MSHKDFFWNIKFYLTYEVKVKAEIIQVNVESEIQ